MWPSSRAKCLPDPQQQQPGSVSDAQKKIPFFRSISDSMPRMRKLAVKGVESYESNIGIGEPPP